MVSLVFQRAGAQLLIRNIHKNMGVGLPVSPYQREGGGPVIVAGAVADLPHIALSLIFPVKDLIAERQTVLADVAELRVVDLFLTLLPLIAVDDILVFHINYQDPLFLLPGQLQQQFVIPLSNQGLSLRLVPLLFQVGLPLF